MEQIVTYLLMVGTEIHKFTSKDLCLGNVSKDFSTIIMKKTWFNGYIYDFSADNNSIDVNHMKDMHKYLMKNNGIV